MKKLTLTNFAFVFFVAFAFVFTGCNNCTDDCNERGICIDGTCDCDPGYEGEACETLSSAKFVGDWSAIDNCTSQQWTYNVEISTASTDEVQLRFINFGGFGATITVNGNITGPDTFTIPSQTVGGTTFEGSGTMNASNNTISITYSADDANNPIDNCNGTWTKI